MIDSLRQVQVVGALARLAGNGGWAEILAGERLRTTLDVADARLLVAADVLHEHADGRLEPVELHPWYDDPSVLASGLTAELRRALRHGTGDDRPSGDDPDEIVAMGAASQSAAAILADAVLPMLTQTRERFDDGTACFLDVGVGTGAISEALCRRFPGTRAVGLDVSPEALTMARDRVAAAGLADRVDLRRVSVVDLDDVDRYDLAWMPQVFLAPDDLERGLDRVLASLRPGGWLVMPVAAPDPGCTPLEAAAVEHDAALRGGGAMSVESALSLLTDAGYADAWDMRGVSQSLTFARKP
ncbi:methyltransferase [Nocardioides lijunqiniae]|uniref:methyltransferase n=1 Tax=Nocardioides lijunqiniae TaxID=2760832 RepID=UPI001878AD32